MIKFRQKQETVDLMPKALLHLKQQGIKPNIISDKEADSVSSSNSRSMVLLEFIKNEDGRYQITIMDKGNGMGGPYPYTQKMIKDQFRMNVLDIDNKKRTITADIEQYGIALDIIEVLAFKYNLSIVR